MSPRKLSKIQVLSSLAAGSTGLEALGAEPPPVHLIYLHYLSESCTWKTFLIFLSAILGYNLITFDLGITLQGKEQKQNYENISHDIMIYIVCV